MLFPGSVTLKGFGGEGFFCGVWLTGCSVFEVCAASKQLVITPSSGKVRELTRFGEFGHRIGYRVQGERLLQSDTRRNFKKRLRDTCAMPRYPTEGTIISITENHMEKDQEHHMDTEAGSMQS